jgi:bacillithiol synthase
MLAVTRPLAVRARVLPRPEAPFDRLHDPLTDDLVGGGSLTRRGASWRDTGALKNLAGKRAPLPTPLAAALVDYHVRLGASDASLAALDRLARGEAACAIAGQQPAPLGGPLYGLHKTASAVGLARRVAARTGVRCEAVYWNHVEDSDFEEIRGATVADAGLGLHDLALPADIHPEGGLVGAVPRAALDALVEDALRHWAGLPALDETADRVRAALRRARDLGEAHAALQLALFGEVGLVVVDPRLPEFRAAARPVIDRYLAAPDAMTAAARRSGVALEGVIGRRPLSEAALESFVFAIENGRRRKIGPAEARALAAGTTLSPSVALRPAVQDAVLPTVAMACGPGEIAYLAQLEEVFAGLGVRAASPVPRMGATWLPQAAVTLMEASGADPWMVVAATDQVLRRHAESRVPAVLGEALADLRGDVARRLDRFAGDATSLDPSLPQLVESARSKIDYQVQRLAEGLVGKARHRMEREHPEWLRVRYYLSPGDRLQERRIASLEPIAHRGVRLVPELCDLAEAHAEALERGEHPHYLLEL